MQLYEAVAVGVRLEVVERRLPQTEPRAHALAELGMGVEPRPGRGPAEGDLRRAPERPLNPVAAEAHLRGVAGELLPERHRHGVHHVGASGLDQLRDLVRLAPEGSGQALYGGEETIAGLLDRGQVDG